MINKIWCVFELDKHNKKTSLLAVFDDNNKAVSRASEYALEAKKEGFALRYFYYVEMRFVQ